MRDTLQTDVLSYHPRRTPYPKFVQSNSIIPFLIQLIYKPILGIAVPSPSTPTTTTHPTIHPTVDARIPSPRGEEACA